MTSDGFYTMDDLGYSDPELLAQLNANVIAQKGGPAVSYYMGQAYIPGGGGGSPPPTYTPAPTVPGGGGSGQPGGGGGNPPVGASPFAPLPTDFGDPGAPPGPTSSGDPCDLITNVYARYACKGLEYIVGRNNNNPGGGGLEACQKGYHRDPKTGACVIDGVGSYIPGDVGKQDVYWSPVNGRYGAGLTPLKVQQIKRACPAGFVLGKDGVCYDHLARTNRAHNPGAKPYMTGGDMNALRRAKSLAKVHKRIGKFFPKKPAAACAPRKKR